MSIKSGIQSLGVMTLAVLFYGFFMTAKHDPALSAVNAFAEDPYDAIGSFGIQAAAFLGLLGLLRAVRRVRSGAGSEAQLVLLARTQLLAVLAVVITLAADSVAMVRYPSLWIGSVDGYRLAALLGGLAVLALGAGVWTCRLVRARRSCPVPDGWARAAIVSLASLAMLFLYPADWRQSTPGALLTVIVGALLLFALMWAWGTLLIPYDSDGTRLATTAPSSWLNHYQRQVGLVILGGFLLGLLFVAGESTEGGGGLNLNRLVFVASVYVGLETTGLLIGYVFLRKPLGLGRTSP